MHMGKTDTGFTAIEAYKFLTVVSCTFCQLQQDFSIITTRNTTQQVASKMYFVVVCCDGAKVPNKNN